MSTNPAADEVGQIRVAAKPDEATTLVHHRVRDDGRPGCGDLVRDWEGHKMTFVVLGPGTPTCGRNGCRPTN